MAKELYSKGNYLLYAIKEGDNPKMFNKVAVLEEEVSHFTVSEGANKIILYKNKASEYVNEDGTPYTEDTLRDFLYDNTGFRRALGSRAVSEMIQKEGTAGYSHTGAFASKPADAQYVWDVGDVNDGVLYSQADVDSETFKVFSLSREVHEQVDNPYWTIPKPTGKKGIGLFQGANLPANVDSLFDFDYNYDAENGEKSNYLLQSGDMTTWLSNDDVFYISEANLPGPNPDVLDAFVVQANSSVVFSTFYKTVVVSAETEYTFRFKVKKYENNNKSSGSLRVRDVSNSTLIISSESYNIEEDWTTVSTTFTTPVGCTSIQVSLDKGTLIDTNAAAVYAQPQVTTSINSPYVETEDNSIVIANQITHQYYALDNGAKTGYEGSTGRIRLDGLQYGDQIRVRFEFNIIPQHSNTTIVPALWYSNRNNNDEITFAFALTTQPVFFGSGTVGKQFDNRIEISAWITSNEDVNALALPAIKSDQEVIIQPLGMLVTVIR